MIFQCDGRRYDTSDMECFQTGQPHQPAVYITNDLRCVFVQTTEGDDGLAVRQAGEAEIRQLWQDHGVSTLLRVLARFDTSS